MPRHDAAVFRAAPPRSGPTLAAAQRDTAPEHTASPRDRAHHPALASTRLAAATAIATLLFGLGITAFSVKSARDQTQLEAEKRFEAHAMRVETSVHQQFNNALKGFQGLRALFLSQRGWLTRKEVRIWVNGQDLAFQYPGVRGLGYIERVPRDRLENFIAYERADDAPEFSVRTSGHAADLFIIKYIEPLAANRPAWGYDIGSEPVRRAAAEASARSGQLTLTPPIALVQDGRQRPGFLYLMPYYDGSITPDTASPEQRERALRGWIYAPIVLEELMAPVGRDAEGLLDFEVFDAAAGPDAAPLYDHDQQRACAQTAPPPAACDHRRFTGERNITVGGRTLRLLVSGTRAFDATVTPASEWRAVMGALGSVLLALLVWVLGSGRARSVALAERMTVDLRAATQQAEAALRDNNALLGALQQHAIVSVTDRRGIITDANDAFTQISGYSHAELIGANHRLVKSSVHDAAFWKAMWRTVARGKPWHGDVCNRAKDGRLYWVDTFITPLVGADGKVEKYISMRIDITAAKNAEAELKRNAKRFELAIEGAEEGLWEWIDVHGREQWWSPQFHRLLGYEPGEVTADLATFEEMIHPDHRQQVSEALNQALYGDGRYNLDFRMRKKSGDYRWFRARAKVYRDDNGRPISMAGALQDIHERRLAMQQVRERNAQLDAVLGLSPDAFVTFGGDGRVSLASPPFTALTGIEVDAVIGLDAAAFLARLQERCAPATHVTQLDELAMTPGGEASQRVVLELLSPARRMLQCALHKTTGRAISQLLHLRDVTHETEVERMKSEFLSMAAHELRTPMASIMGFTELMLMRETPPERQRDMLQRILRNSQTMSELINELLDLARIEARRGSDFRLEVVDLGDIARQVAGDFQPPQGRAALDWQHDEAPRWVRIDSAKLQQAVLNLVSNAYKYSPAGKPVQLHMLTDTAGSTPRYGIRVIDQGMGMSAEQLSHLGERFYRADKSGNIPGTGLGISIVKQTVELLGGAFEVDSTEGKGTRVTLWLPGAAAPTAAPCATPSATEAGNQPAGESVTA